MTSIAPDTQIARDEALLAAARTAISDLASEIEILKQQIRSGEDADLKQAAAKLSALDGWMRNYVTLENRLAELRTRYRGPDEGGLALNLDRARFEIGCRLARLRTAKCKGRVPE